MSSPLRVAFVGWGAIARAAASLLADASVEIVAVAVRDADAERVGVPPNALVTTDAAAVLATAPDVVAEAAGRDSVGPWARAALGAGIDIIVSSGSAFTDATLLDDLRTLAATAGAQIHVQPGAVGGIDALAAARTMGLDEVEHRIVKPAAAWRGTDAETLCDLDAIGGPTEFAAGSAATISAAFPKNANVAMTVALAGIGADATRVALVADPAATANRHEIRARGAFGEFEMIISNNPLPDNPKSSAMAALGLARAITNRVSAVAI